MIDLRSTTASLIGLMALAQLASAQTTGPSTAPATNPAAPAAAPAPKGKTTAVIIVGAPGTPMYARHYQDRAKRFEAVLRGAGLESGRILTLADPSQSADAVLKSLREVVPTLKPDDQFVLILLGHGAVADNSVTLMLAGPDLEMKAVAAELGKLKSRSQVVMNFSASAGDAMALFALPGRINIAGGVAGQVNDNDFAEFVLRELEASPSASLLETYNRATERFAKWIVRQKQPPGEGQKGWVVEGSESAALFRKLYDADDVPAERRFFASDASGKPDDPNPPLTAQPTDHWSKRRVVTETPALDDVAKGAPATAIAAQGFTAVAPTTQAPVGAVAGKTVLGRAN